MLSFQAELIGPIMQIRFRMINYVREIIVAFFFVLPNSRFYLKYSFNNEKSILFLNTYL